MQYKNTVNPPDRSRKHFVKAAKRRAFIAIFLLFSFLLPIAGINGNAAAESGDTKKDKAEGIKKREVVYGDLDYEGKSRALYVVNNFVLDKACEFEDYGEYSSVTRLTGDSDPVLSNGKVKLKADKGNYYYQGNLKATELPWIFKIKYFLDGKAVKAEELPGKKGRIKTEIDVSRNKALPEKFFDKFSLQIQMSFDADKNLLVSKDKNCMAADAANKRMLSWIVMPGKEGSFWAEIESTDFELDPITFSGITLSMDIKLPDMEDQLSGLDKLSNGIKELSDASSKLNQGFSELQANFSKLVPGAGKLASNGESLSSGADKLSSGLKEFSINLKNYTDGVSALMNGLEPLVSSSEKIRDGLKSISDQMPSKDQLASLLPSEEKLKQLAELAKNSSAFLEKLKEVSASLSEINTFLSQIPQPDPSIDKGAYLDWHSYWNDELTNSGAVFSDPAAKEALAGKMAAHSEAAEKYKYVYDELVGSDKFSNINTELTALAAQYEQINTGIQKLVKEIKTYAAYKDFYLAMYDALDQGIEKLSTQYVQFDAGLSSVGEAAGKISGSGSQIAGGGEKLSSGLEEYASGLSRYAEGAKQLSNGLMRFNAEGFGSFAEGMEKYSEGAAKFRDETRDLKVKFTQELQKKIDEFTAASPGMSFTSEKNDDRINTLQFVMMTDAISKPDKVNAHEVKREKGFFERLKDLFVKERQ